MNHLEMALSAAESAAADPRNASQHARRAVDAIQAHRAQVLYPELGASRIIVLDNVSSLAAAAAGPVPTTSAGYQVEWPAGDGVCNGFFGGTLDGAIASLSNLWVRIQVNGQYELFSTGKAEGYVPLISLRGGLQGDALPWWRLRDAKVSSNGRWTVYFRNYDTGAAHQPFFLFSFREATA